jgi:hypothetical protein
MAEKAESQTQQTPPGPTRLMSREMSVYYANCVMVATSPRDISLYFGRFVPTSDDKGNQALSELYERQIYMTLEQTEDLIRILSQTMQTVKSRRNGAAGTTGGPSRE